MDSEAGSSESAAVPGASARDNAVATGRPSSDAGEVVAGAGAQYITGAIDGYVLDALQSSHCDGCTSSCSLRWTYQFDW